ncbi:MAG: YgiT-type zinc finger protein [Synergistaceae bacterium]|nr:YgiT-type zinc finger protein [Synergistaceae bacterium]MBR0081059.1 YgiT-type zinc finger protein [Synergistaceae bacterium]MBR0317648.1 YgiT-type zinc finger protein [Synergistaceae bacterium]
MIKCMRCGKDVYKSTTAEAIEMDFGLLVIRNIPCYKCSECDEIFYSGDVALKIEEITETVKQFSQELTIIDYKKAA